MSETTLSASLEAGVQTFRRRPCTGNAKATTCSGSYDRCLGVHLGSKRLAILHLSLTCMLANVPAQHGERHVLQHALLPMQLGTKSWMMLTRRPCSRSKTNTTPTQATSRRSQTPTAIHCSVATHPTFIRTSQTNPRETPRAGIYRHRADAGARTSLAAAAKCPKSARNADGI